MNGLSKWLPFRRDERGGVPQAVTVRREDPFFAMHRDLERLFDGFFGPSRLTPLATPSLSTRVQDFFGDFAPQAFSPSLDLADEKDHLRLTAELPGLSPEDLQIDVENDCLVLSGEKRSESKAAEGEGGYWRTERSFGSFRRVVPLPTAVDESRAEATFTSGILTIRLPKRQDDAKKSKRIQIKN